MYALAEMRLGSDARSLLLFHHVQWGPILR